MLVSQELVLEPLADDLASVDLASNADTYSFALKDHTFASSLATASAIAQIVSSAVASTIIANMPVIASSSAAFTYDTLHYFADPSHRD